MLSSKNLSLMQPEGVFKLHQSKYQATVQIDSEHLLIIEFEI